MKMIIIAKVRGAITIIFLIGFSAFSTVHAQDVFEKAKPQEEAKNFSPDFRLPDLDGNLVSSSSLKGKFTVIHFATTWCPFCNAEAPYLEQLHLDYKSKNVQVFIIDVLEPKTLVIQKIKNRFNLSFPILLDEDGAVATRFAPAEVLPALSRDEVMLASNLIVDPSGKIQYMSLLDSKNFDSQLIGLKNRLDELLADDKMIGGADFVQVKTVDNSILKAGQKKGSVMISFKIKDGYHIQANKVNDNNLVAANLKIESKDGITVGTPIFPDWKMFRLTGTEEMLWVFDETVDVRIPVSVAGNQMPGNIY